jgi:serine/threonine-protein phosphatase 6 regulatory subunit 3
MSLLNRTVEQSRIYDSEGRLQGGLGGLEDLAQVISIDTGDDRDDPMDEAGDETEPALELPITNHHDSPTLDSDDDMSDGPGSSDDDAMEEIAMYDEPQSQLELSPTIAEPPLPHPPVIVPSSPNASSLPPPSEIAAQGAALSRGGSLGPGMDTDATSRPRSRASSRKSSRRANTTGETPNATSTIGEKLKQRFLEINVLSTLLVCLLSLPPPSNTDISLQDLFFAFPWNNFLHSAVYDMVHQILTGYVDTGLNRELAISLFRDARLMHRIVEGQKMNDAEM